jgi:hypothetical protein
VDEGKADLWDLLAPGASSVRRLELPAEIEAGFAARGGAFERDSSHVLVLFGREPESGKVELLWTRWEAATGRMAGSARLRTPEGTFGAASSPTMICEHGVALWAGGLHFWPAAGGKPNEARTFQRPPRAKTFVDRLGVDPEGGRVLATHRDGVLIWDVRSGELSRELDSSRPEVTAARITRGASLVVGGMSDASVTFWDFADGREVRNFSTGRRSLAELSASPSGSHVAYPVVGGVEIRDFSRPQKYSQLMTDVAAARATLRRDPDNAQALETAGRWLALRGADDWAVANLERARRGGAKVSALTLGRCYWRLERFDDARRELAKALETGEEDADYLRLCVAALERPIAKTPREEPAPTTRVTTRATTRPATPPAG